MNTHTLGAIILVLFNVYHFLPIVKRLLGFGSRRSSKTTGERLAYDWFAGKMVTRKPL